MRSNLKQIFANSRLSILLLSFIVLIILLCFVFFRNDATYISYENYEKLLSNNLIKSATIEYDTTYLTTYNNKTYAISNNILDPKKLPSDVVVKVASDNTILILAIFFTLIMGGFYLIINLIQKNTKLDKKTKSVVKEENSFKSDISPVISNVKFSDVAGISEVKGELVEIVDFLKNPQNYRSYGIKLPKGVLMVGPPGVGKTLIAKAVAGEANVPFFYQSGSSFAEIFVGMGAKRVRELFAKAKANAPSIIFIDEIDSVGKSRGEGRNDEREATLNQLLTEMDGFEDNSGVIVIAATNKIEVIDEALLRSGRFDRRIFLNLPNFNDRIDILKIYLKNKMVDVNLEEIAKLSVGFSGAGLDNLVNEAAINALRRRSKVIELKDFEMVKNKVLIGNKKSKIFTQDEKEIQAFYQGAKAICAFWYLVPFDKITLLEDKFVFNDEEIVSKTELENKIRTLVAGFVALKIYKGDIFSTSSEDIYQARIIAQKMVYEYFMGESMLPNDLDVEKILSTCLEDVKNLLTKKQKYLNIVQEILLKNEHISYMILKKILS